MWLDSGSVSLDRAAVEEGWLAHKSRRVSAVVVAVVAALFAFAIPAAPMSLASRLLASGALLLVEILCLRALTMGVRANHTGLIVTGLLTRRHFSWPEIVGFVVRGHGAEAKLMLTLRDGKEVQLSGIMPAVWARSRDQTLNDLVTELQRWMRSLET